MFYLAVAILIAVSLLALEMSNGLRVRALPRQIPQPGGPSPQLSIVVAARNEERNIEAALRSLLAQEAIDYEVIMVEDRSTDSTPAIVDRLALDQPRLRVIHLTELADGWLGKNRALHEGAKLARGEFILFTDADVIFERSVIARAVAFAKREGIDHLCAGPRVVSPTVPLGIFVNAFIFFFFIYSRPWHARNRRSKAHVGIGAFNLVRSDAYRAVGGHEKVKLRPDDDVMLGKILKQNGSQQEIVDARGDVEVEWYSSLPEAIDGLMKNAFSGLRYSVLRLMAASVFLFGMNVLPFLAIFFTRGTTQLLFGATAFLLVCMLAGIAVRSRSPWWYALGFPAAAMLFLYVCWKSALLTLRQGGIYWRGTFYPLAELRRNRV
jgi:glycosyltransferase involved in cell wall biosynthesis